MSPIEPSEHIYIAASSLPGAGRGVFAKEKIVKGTLIEQCPVVSLENPIDRKYLRKTGLVNYYFLWGDSRNRVAMCLGWGSVYNHSFTPNAQYTKIVEDDRMDFYAIEDIEAGEEITVNYNGNPNDTRRLRIPGVPEEAGGPVSPGLPPVLAGIIRRLKRLTRN